MILGGLGGWVSLWVRFGGSRLGCRGYLFNVLGLSYFYSEGWGLWYRFSFITC